MKASTARVSGVWRDVFKDPVTDSGKRSRKGRLALIREEGHYETVRADGNHWRDLLKTAYEDGKLTHRQMFEDIRARSNLLALD